jgi:mevalonate-3-phosphate-5-kinase
MVVGGIPGVGKTSISGHLLRTFNMDIMLSMDYVREFVRGTGMDKEGVLNTSVYDAWQRFGEKTPENILRGYKEQGAILSKGTNAVIERAIKNKESLVFETLYFIPEQLTTLSNDEVISLYIQVSDQEVHKRMLLERDQYTHPGQSGDRLAEHISDYRIMAKDALFACRKAGITVFDNLNYQKTKTEITEFIATRIA